MRCLCLFFKTFYVVGMMKEPLSGSWVVLSIGLLVRGDGEGDSGTHAYYYNIFKILKIRTD